MTSQKTKIKKAMSEEAKKLHKIYGIIIALLIVGFLWVLHSYQISDQVLRDLERVGSGQHKSFIGQIIGYLKLGLSPLVMLAIFYFTAWEKVKSKLKKK